MPTSHFDLLFYEFQCPSPECGERFKQILRGLVQDEKVPCPKCGAAIDIRETKTTGELGKWFDTAAQLDIQANQKK